MIHNTLFLKIYILENFKNTFENILSNMLEFYLNQWPL